jgi:DNA-directed RNA polymerase specialized sigma24 family protein
MDFKSKKDIVIKQSNKILDHRRGQREKLHDLSHVEDLYKNLENSKHLIKETTKCKLELICKQTKYLKTEAKEIIQDALKNIELSQIKCNFVKREGYTYCF